MSTEDVDKMLKSQELVADGYLPISIEEINKDTSLYVLVMMQGSLKKSEHKYEIIQFNESKPPRPEAFRC